MGVAEGPAARENSGPAAKRLRVLHVGNSFDETSMPYNELALPLRDKQDISLCSFFDGGAEVPPGIESYVGGHSFAGFFRALRSALDDGRPDVIHVHTCHVGTLYLLLSLFRARSATPHSVFTVHNSFENYHKLKTWLLLIPVFAFFERVVCCSRASFDTLPALYRWLGGKRLCWIQNGADLERVDRSTSGAASPVGAGAFRVASVGRLIPTKNPHNLLEAFRSAGGDDDELVFIGVGELLDPLMNAVREADLVERVTFAGLIPREQVYAELLRVDLFVSTSRGEGLPVATLEAMACSCPVLLSDIQPHRSPVPPCHPIDPFRLPLDSLC